MVIRDKEKNRVKSFAAAAGFMAATVIPGMLSSCSTFNSEQVTKKIEKPNVVLIFTDDQGYSDVGVYGSTDIKTPNIDKLAGEGVKFTNFYASAPVCTPSRAGLLTGCYPKRIGMGNGVMFPNDLEGMNPSEVTIADMLKSDGYDTMMIGKWHLGRPDEVLPTSQGFDHYFGIPYSNDMTPDHPYQMYMGGPWPRLPLMEDTTVIDDGTDETFGFDQKNLTKMYTERAVDYINSRSEDEDPFFLYMAHNQPHYPNFSSAAFEGSSERGRYGDAVQEVDWSVGEIIKALEDNGMDENTIIIFTSDNGPWKFVKDMKKDAMGHWSIWSDGTTGNAEPLSGWKSETLEGGQRVPAIIKYPGVIPSGKIISEMSSNLDILPTIADYAGIDITVNPVIDGKSIRALLENPETGKSASEYFLYYDGDGCILRAIRNAEGYKLQIYDEQFSEGYETNLNNETQVNRLHFLPNDISTSIDISAEHPEIVQELLDTAARLDKEITDNVRPKWSKE